MGQVVAVIKRPVRYFTGIVLSLLLLAVLQVTLVTPPTSASGYLAPQAAALRAPFRHHLAAIADAPFYHISATVDLESAGVDGRLNLRYTNASTELLSELVFWLLPNATTIYGGGSLSVESVTLGNEALDFELSEARTLMRVPLSRPLAPGQALSLDIKFTTQLPINTQRGYGILNQTSSVTSLAGWYPLLTAYRAGWRTADVPQVGDALMAETSLYEVSLTVPAEVTVVSTGAVSRLEKTPSEATWHLVSGPAREFAIAISEDFEQHQAQVGGVTVRFHSLPASYARTSPEAALTEIVASFDVFAAQFGPYPFAEFDVVELPISIGGYEFPGMVYVDDHLRSQGDPADYRYIIAHEVAHQWWYGLVANDSINEPWLDESLASYSAAIYLEQTRGERSAAGLLAYWRRTYGTPRAQDPPVNSSALGFSNWLAYRSPVYYQGALFLDALRAEMGDDLFFLFLKRYLAAYRYQLATTEDFLRLAEAITCRDLDPFFERWFELDAPIAPEQCALGLLGEPNSNAPR
jgi:aminopeptidase N